MNVITYHPDRFLRVIVIAPDELSAGASETVEYRFTDCVRLATLRYAEGDAAAGDSPADCELVFKLNAFHHPHSLDLAGSATPVLGRAIDGNGLGLSLRQALGGQWPRAQPGDILAVTFTNRTLSTLKPRVEIAVIAEVMQGEEAARNTVPLRGSSFRGFPVFYTAMPTADIAAGDTAEAEIRIDASDEGATLRYLWAGVRGATGDDDPYATFLAQLNLGGNIPIGNRRISSRGLVGVCNRIDLAELFGGPIYVPPTTWTVQFENPQSGAIRPFLGFIGHRGKPFVWERAEQFSPVAAEVEPQPSS